jgi:hypothetical protein
VRHGKAEHRRLLAAADDAAGQEVLRAADRAANFRKPPYQKTTVHLLRHGLPLCGFSTKVPGEWPPNHVWVGAFAEMVGLKEPQVPCEGCGRQHWLEKK